MVKEKIVWSKIKYDRWLPDDPLQKDCDRLGEEKSCRRAILPPPHIWAGTKKSTDRAREKKEESWHVICDVWIWHCGKYETLTHTVVAQHGS
jgi:hypothetical protein